LQNFLPDNTYAYIVPFIEQYTIHLTITKDRKQVLGDYRNPTPDKPFHRISINGTLNKYSFLITLLHEIAHLITFVHHQHKVSPHGKEWKSFFSNLLAPLMGKSIFPTSVEKALIKYIKNPGASSCSDPHLFKALLAFDQIDEKYCLLEQLSLNSLFKSNDGHIYQLLEKRRTRYVCEQQNTKKKFLFPGIFPILPINTA
jgi:hypothetical protein